MIDTLKRQNGSALISSIIFLCIIAMMSAVSSDTSILDLGYSNKFVTDKMAYYTAEAGLKHGISVAGARGMQAALDGTLLPPTTFPAGGKCAYTVSASNNVDDPNGSALIDSDRKIVITSAGVCGTATKTLTAVIHQADVAPVALTGIHAAITVGGASTISGNATIDGRDHDVNGNALSTVGIISECYKGANTVSGNAHFGGWVNGTRIDPTSQLSQMVGLQNNVPTLTNPAYPDDVLGLAPGTLESIAKSGLSGSQYVIGMPKTPMHGVTFIDMAFTNSGSINFAGSDGILVVVGAMTDSAGPTGSFNGLIIVMGAATFSGNFGILGGIVTVGAFTDSGNIQIDYSSATINNALKVVNIATPDQSRDQNRVTVLSVRTP